MEEVKEAGREREQPQLSGRIHVLGLGSTGTFIAHSLAARPSPPPITLLMHHPSFYDSYHQQQKRLSVDDDIRSGFDVEIYENEEWSSPKKNSKTTRKGRHQDTGESTDDIGKAQADGPIECLVVCSRAHITPQALRKVKHRLNSDSTVCFIHKGMGMVDKLNETLFTDPKSRPNYIQGIFTHGLLWRFPYGISHKVVGSLILSPVVTSQTPVIDAEVDTHWAPSTKYLLRVLTLTSSLVATVDTPVGLLAYQLEKTVVNSIIQPLTAINDCTPSELLYVFAATRIMRLLLFEITAVIKALPELQGVPGIDDQFSPERLRRLVTNECLASAERETAMRRDIEGRRSTEIEYFNGWFIRRGEELGIKCALNYMIVQLIQLKVTITQRREFSAIPIDLKNVVLTGDRIFDD